MNKFAFYFIPFVLFGCGGNNNSTPPIDTVDNDFTVTENDQDDSIFISSLDLSLDTTEVTNVNFNITPKENALAEAINATFDIDSLESSGTAINLPIWGMYADYENTVNITVNYSDGSEQVTSYTLSTEEYVDPNSIYDQVVVNQSADANNKPSYNYFYLENSSDQGPVILDIDGNIRWTANSTTGSYRAATFDNGKFIIHSGSNIIHLSLSGDETVYPIEEVGLTNIRDHHETTSGKFGYFLNIDATKNNTNILEAILLEVEEDGSYIDQWDVGEIIADYMELNGEDSTLLVRDGVDWFHMNSAIYDASDDSIIISGRELFVIKIDYTTKAIKWVLGDETKYWAEFPSLLALSLQSNDTKPIGEHALSVTDGQLILFNNGQSSFNQPEGVARGESLSTSLAMKWIIDEETMSASVTWEYDAGLYSDICSSIYEKEDSNLITYASVNRLNDEAEKTVIQDVSEDQNIIFEFEHPTSCTTWNSDIVALESLVY